MCIPVEVLSDDCGHQLESVQDDLVQFGLNSSVALLAQHVYSSSFPPILMMGLYPVLAPKEIYGIYQTWR